MTLFRNEYRIESARRRNWDYSATGWYFVTICTRQKAAYLGRVLDGVMNLSAIGDYAARCWREIPVHHPNVEIDEFIVMPNHVHGIIVLTGPEQQPVLQKREKIKRTVELASAHPIRGSLGATIGSFKSVISYWCRTQGLEFGWQARFYDRIIRGRNSLKAIREYIRKNPENWARDTLFCG
jgi:putative transposase